MSFSTQIFSMMAFFEPRILIFSDSRIFLCCLCNISLTLCWGHLSCSRVHYWTSVWEAFVFHTQNVSCPAHLICHNQRLYICAFRHTHNFNVCCLTLIWYFWLKCSKNLRCQWWIVHVSDEYSKVVNMLYTHKDINNNSTDTYTNTGGLCCFGYKWVYKFLASVLGDTRRET